MVLDANIVICAVLGVKVGGLLVQYAETVDFYARLYVRGRSHTLAHLYVQTRDWVGKAVAGLGRCLSPQ
jgi:hypothetical protein